MSGRSKKYDGQILRVKVFFQGQRIPVDQKENWFCHLPNHNPNRKISLIVEDSEKEININLANLFSVKFTTDSSGLLMPVTPWNQNSQQSLIPFIEPPPQSWEKSLVQVPHHYFGKQDFRSYNHTPIKLTRLLEEGIMWR